MVVVRKDLLYLPVEARIEFKIIVQCLLWNWSQISNIINYENVKVINGSVY